MTQQFFFSPAVIASIVALILIYFWYVKLISSRNNARQALASVDVQLRQRFDLIPNILAIAKKFMEHEKSLLTEITELRTSATKSYSQTSKEEITNHLKTSEILAGKMGQLMVAVENYPDLKSDQTMVQAMQTYNEVEAQISAARRFYNSAVTDLNNSVEIFPGNLIAKLAGVSALPFYQAEEAAKAPIDAKNFL